VKVQAQGQGLFHNVMIKLSHYLINNFFFYYYYFTGRDLEIPACTPGEFTDGIPSSVFPKRRGPG
jgi:hypothetical protein